MVKDNNKTLGFFFVCAVGYTEYLVYLLRNKWTNERGQSHFHNLLIGNLHIVNRLLYQRSISGGDCFEFRK